jgi:hypothetical protein
MDKERIPKKKVECESKRKMPKRETKINIGITCYERCHRKKMGGK